MSGDEGARVLVTGASGYIATHVVQQLLQSGQYRVRGTVRSLTNPTKVEPIRNLCANPKYPLELVEADLEKDEGWVEAVKDCTYIMHTASPFPAANPRNEEEVIRPAVDGTLRVFKAARQVGGIKRIVLTSSVAAVSAGFDDSGDSKWTEENWTDTNRKDLGAYVKSKVLAEKAAWDFLKELPENEMFELAVINPVFVMGPVLCGGAGASMEVMQKLMEHQVLALPKLNFPITDVRDVAQSHLRAMVLPEAAGKRHILYTDSLWMEDIAKILDAEFKQYGYKVPMFVAPKFVIYLSSIFDKTLQSIVPMIGKVAKFDNSRMTKVLGVEPTDIKKTFFDMGYSMIEAGHVKKTEKYKEARS